MNILKASQQDVYPRRNSCTSVLLSFFFFFYLPLVITSGCFMHPRVYIIIYAQKNDIYRILFTLVIHIDMVHIILFSLWRVRATKNKHSLMRANPVYDFCNRLINSLKLKITNDSSNTKRLWPWIYTVLAMIRP